jgi:cyclophilin family peptidyl-prolyl cis-trans isomerase
MAAPTAIRLSQAAINESEAPGGFVAILASTDADPGDTFTYALVDGEGDEHNAWFAIQDNLLVNSRVVDREQLSRLSVRLRSTDSRGESVEQAFSLAVNNLQDPLLLQAPQAISFSRSGGRFSVVLSDWFSDPFSSGRIARFQLDPALAATIQEGFGASYPELLERSWLDVVLFDQEAQGAPLTAANLERYVEAGRYSDTFLHRLVPSFVLQGGGFAWPGDAQAGNASLEAVATFAAVPNEFSAQRSNIRGTVAMAKLGSDPNSATSQWFFSLADNSANLDIQNGGFTVFGRLRDSTDLLLLDVLGGVGTVNAGGVFSDLPLYKLGDSLDPTDVLRFASVELLEEPPLQFALSVPAGSPMQTQLDSNGVLHVDAITGASTSTETTALTLSATNLLGETVQRRLDVITNRWSADLDGNGVIDPLSDGLSIAAAASGQALPLLDPRVDAELQSGIAEGHLDLDGNGRVDTVDAQLLLRFSFGTFPGGSLHSGLVDPGLHSVVDPFERLRPGLVVV